MGRTYICEFCNRSFSDTPPARKKHLKSLQHQRLKKLHYDSFKDPTQMIEEELRKLPCKRFFQSGQCDFGDNCKFSHKDYRLLQESLNQARRSKASCAEPNLDEWLSKWRQKNPESEGAQKLKITEKYDITQVLPKGFPPLHELPPSLMPPPQGGYPSLPRVDWG